MPARTRRITCDVCAAYGDASANTPSWDEVRQELEHCQYVIEQTLRRFVACDTEASGDDDPYQCGPQGAD
jgi:hypothetical protein